MAERWEDEVLALKAQNAELVEKNQTLAEFKHLADEMGEFLSGIVGLLVRYGLFMTGATYVIAAAQLTPESVPGASAFAFPVVFWRTVYWLTPLSAMLLWFWPNWVQWGPRRIDMKAVRAFHIAVPTMSLGFSIAALGTHTFGTFLPARIDKVGWIEGIGQSLFTEGGGLGNIVVLSFVLGAQFVYLWATIRFKAGRRYQTRTA